MRRLFSSRCNTLCSVAFISNTHTLLSSNDPEESEREKALRNKILEKYKGMPFPEMQNPEYGSFATQGPAATAAGQGAASQATFGGFPQGPKPKVDWLMLFTGCVIVYFSGKIMLQQMNRGVDDLDMPLWIGSIYLQTQHIMFNIQFDKETREQLKKEFHEVRMTNLQNLQPPQSFFDFVRYKRPEFGSGRLYNAQTVSDALMQSLCSTDSRALMQFVRAVQQSLQIRGGTPESRLDDFMSRINSLPGMSYSPPVGANRLPTANVWPTNPTNNLQGNPPPTSVNTSTEGSAGSVPFS